jgi:hypothetical protein
MVVPRAMKVTTMAMKATATDPAGSLTDGIFFLLRY